MQLHVQKHLECSLILSIIPPMAVSNRVKLLIYDGVHIFLNLLANNLSMLKYNNLVFRRCSFEYIHMSTCFSIYVQLCTAEHPIQINK
jgi:hypothetical protein